MEISIQNLKKVYKNGHQALNDVSLNIQNGMFGLLGPNGAGKTTLMRILVCLMEPSQGKVFVNGMELHKHRKEVRRMIGYLPQDFTMFSKLKTWEMLDYAAALAGLREHAARINAVDEMLTKVGLFDVRERLANKLSGGMKRRLGIAQALIGNPKIIVVDEPTVGLDPEERLRFRNLLADLSRQEVIIVLSTHIVGDISSTCHDMALLNEGNIIFKASPEELIDKAKGHVWEITAMQHELEQIKEQYPVITTIPAENGFEVKVVGHELKGYSGVPVTPNLEDAYVYFMEVIEAKE